MPTLEERLATLRDGSAKRLKPEVKATVDRHIAHLREGGAPARALQAGATAPAFVLHDRTGASVSSSELLARGPLVVSFFRGTWCPYCDAELLALAEAYADIRATGAELVVITPQSAQTAAPYLDAHPVPFAVLVDPGAVVAADYGVAYDVTGDLRDLYANVFKNDLAVVNAGGSWRLPMPARFVIDRTCTVIDVRVDPDYRFRPEPAETIAVLKRLTAPL
jgi:peroxiredoxin